MRGDLVIGIDSSTTATKAIALDRRGRTVAEGRAAVPLSNPRPAGSSRRSRTGPALPPVAEASSPRKIDMTRVAALAISNQRESFAQFDAEGPGAASRHPVARRARARRGERACRQDRRRTHPRDLRQAQRCHALPLALCRGSPGTCPALWKKTAKTAEVHGVLTHFLTGHWQTSTASADPMGLIDMARYDWSDELHRRRAA